MSLAKNHILEARESAIVAAKAQEILNSLLLLTRPSPAICEIRDDIYFILKHKNIAAHVQTRLSGIIAMREISTFGRAKSDKFSELLAARGFCDLAEQYKKALESDIISVLYDYEKMQSSIVDMVILSTSCEYATSHAALAEEYKTLIEFSARACNFARLFGIISAIITINIAVDIPHADLHSPAAQCFLEFAFWLRLTLCQNSNDAQPVSASPTKNDTQLANNMDFASFLQYLYNLPALKFLEIAQGALATWKSQYTYAVQIYSMICFYGLDNKIRSKGLGDFAALESNFHICMAQKSQGRSIEDIEKEESSKKILMAAVRSYQHLLFSYKIKWLVQNRMNSMNIKSPIPVIEQFSCRIFSAAGFTFADILSDIYECNYWGDDFKNCETIHKIDLDVLGLLQKASGDFERLLEVMHEREIRTAVLFWQRIADKVKYVYEGDLENVYDYLRICVQQCMVAVRESSNITMIKLNLWHLCCKKISFIEAESQNNKEEIPKIEFDLL